jgi:hypothetical protein
MAFSFYRLDKLFAIRTGWEIQLVLINAADHSKSCFFLNRQKTHSFFKPAWLVAVARLARRRADC